MECIEGKICVLHLRVGWIENGVTCECLLADRLLNWPIKKATITHSGRLVKSKYGKRFIQVYKRTVVRAFERRRVQRAAECRSEEMCVREEERLQIRKERGK